MHKINFKYINYMRKQILNLTLCTLVMTLCCFSSCKQEDTFVDVDGQSPAMELVTDHVRTEYGKQFTLAGKISDKDGLKSVQLVCLELDLEKTIDLQAIYDETKYEYDLSYKFTMPEEVSGNEFTIKVIVTDLGGRTTEQNVKITLDGDSTAPVISDVNPIDKIVYVLLAESNIHNLSFKVTDDKGLSYVKIVIPELNVNETEQIESEGVKELNFTKSYTLLSENKEYNVEITVADLLGNTQSYTYKIIASNAIDYNQMYLVDFVNNEELSLYAFGSHVTMIRTAPYTYKATYYSHGNAQLRFTVSDTNFDLCYGESMMTSGTLTMEYSDMQTVNIEQEGYYDITIDVFNLTYSISEHTANVTDYGQLTVYGQGWQGAESGIWTPASEFIMKQDSNNKAFYSTEITMTESGGSGFCIGICKYDETGQSWGDKFWYYDSSVGNYGPTQDWDWVTQYGTYELTIDTYLGRGYMKLKQ